MKKKLIFSLAIVSALAISTFPKEEAKAATNWNIVWQDEFDGSGINTSNWKFENGAGGWGNNELEYYTNRSENARIENGNLLIEARKEAYGGMQYTSARMKTEGTKEFKYGKIEARMKLPKGQGIWPAFWMLGSNINQGVGWPGCGEIDIMENVNNESNIHGTIHWDYNGHSEYGGTSGAIDVTQYHTYSIEWNESSIKWFVDGVQYKEANIANSINGTDEFHKPFFILLNLAVGGNWPGSPDGTTQFPAKMYVDYVRVYQNGGETSNPSNGISNGDYYLTAIANNKVVCADNTGNDPLIANRNALGGAWESLSVVNNSDGTISLKSNANGKYICAVIDSKNELIARSTAIGTWEKFTLQKITDNQYALKSVANNNFVKADLNNNGVLYASSPLIGGAWEAFTITPIK
jgi:beta-glucanase (GH16 family)